MSWSRNCPQAQTRFLRPRELGTLPLSMRASEMVRMSSVLGSKSNSVLAQPHKLIKLPTGSKVSSTTSEFFVLSRIYSRKQCACENDVKNVLPLQVQCAGLCRLRRCDWYCNMSQLRYRTMQSSSQIAWTTKQCSALGQRGVAIGIAMLMICLHSLRHTAVCQ